jgi:hypothetical protein
MKKKSTEINENALAIAGGIGDPTLASTSHMVQGSFPGYTYQVLGFNDTLQQKPNKPSNEYYIHPGCLVRGVGVNNPKKKYTGRVNRIVKDEKGVVVCLYILSQKNCKMVTIQADDNLELLIHKEEDQKGIYTSTPQYNMNIGRSML